MEHAQKPDFVFRRNGQVHLNRRGYQFSRLLGVRISDSRAHLKRDGTRAETRFGLSEKWTSPFKSAGESVQSTAGSR